MDAHRDQVERARAAASGGAPRLYFSYGTALDGAAFDEWREQHGYDFALPPSRLAEARGFDLVFDFPSRWWGGRVAGLTEAPNRSVHGRVFSIRAEDWPIIQHKEGAITGMCVEREIEVRVGDDILKATAFSTAPARRSFEGAVSPRFLEALLRGGRAAGLPEAYLAEVETRQF